MFDEAECKHLRERCLEQDDKAWRELYRRSFNIARSTALAPPFRFDVSTAEDLAQDVVVELAKKIREVENWIGFTGRVAHNKCVDRVRKKKEIPLSTLMREGEEGFFETISPPGFLPEMLDDDVAMAFLRSALADLGQPCQNLLRVRFFDELSYSDAAVQVSIPSDQVGVYISRCLDRLRKKIEAQPRIWAELKAMMESSGEDPNART